MRRRVAELEAAAAEHQRAEHQLERDARLKEAELRLSQDTARAVLESASEGIILIDTTGRITLVNTAAERMFGYSRAELLGEPLEILLPQRVRRDHVAHRTGYFAEPRIRPMGIGLDLSGRRNDGTEFPVEISLSHVKSAEGGIAIALITDITERKRVETQLQRQREVLYQNEKLAALGTMAAGIAHEMNNPLGIITTRIEVMLLDAEQQQLPAQVLEDLQVLHRASQRVARIAASLRSFARHSPGDRVPLDLNAVVDESLQLMQKPLAADNVQIVASLDRGTGADPRRRHHPSSSADEPADQRPGGDADRRPDPHRDGASRAAGLGSAPGSGHRPRHPGRGGVQDLRSVLHDEAHRDRPRTLRDLRHHPGARRHRRRAVSARHRDHVHPQLPGDLSGRAVKLSSTTPWSIER